MDQALSDTGELRRRLDRLIWRVIAFEREHAGDVAAVQPSLRASARNLLHYLSLRQLDLRPLQQALRNRGLSSLGRLEACVLQSLVSVRGALDGATDQTMSDGGASAGGVGYAAAPADILGFEAGAALLEARAASLFGPPPGGRNVRIMVTMPSEAATDPQLIATLAAAGMDVMRINSAHDDADAWIAMIARLHAAEQTLGRRVCIALDLAGPKLRTGPPAHTLGIARLRPHRGPRGEVVVPCIVPLIDNPLMPLPEDVAAALADGDELEVRDARGRVRRGPVEVRAGRVTVAFDRTVYVESNAKVQLFRDGRRVARGRLGVLPPAEIPIRVQRGDRIRVLRRLEPATDREGCIGCSLPAALEHVETGQAIWFDDGSIGGVVVATDADGVDVEVRHLRGAGANLRAAKGINLPDTEIHLPAMTEADLAVLLRLAPCVDLIGMSFVRTPADVLALHASLDAAGAEVGVILKIESRQGFERLPQILLAAMQRGPFAVMVARGDLAVEVGFERLAEVQEEILWLCEAAHVPVIWATQVLEGLSQHGAPSRAEVTDAAMSERAECVMLNKGPYAADAVRFLDGVLRRMQEHQYKKRAMLRRLHVSEFE